MKNVLTAIVMMAFLCVSTGIMAQEKSDRKARKEAKKAEYIDNLETFSDWVDSREFVILTNSMTGRNGSIYNLHPTVNFIEVDGNRILIQTANPSGIGLNGLGGVTTQGRISQIRVFENENDEPISMLIHFTTPALGTANMTVHVNGDGNATAFLRGNWGRQVTFRGEFSQTDSAVTYKGMQHL